jgi:hypothetical protein
MFRCNVEENVEWEQSGGWKDMASLFAEKNHGD